MRARETTYRNAVRVLLADALGLGLALLEGVLVLELASHVCGVGGGRWKRVVMLVAVRDVCTKSNEGRTSVVGS